MERTVHATGQERPGILERSAAWREARPSPDPAHPAFIDAIRASTALAPTHGRAPHGRRRRAAIPHGHRQITTFVAGPATRGLNI